MWLRILRLCLCCCLLCLSYFLYSQESKSQIELKSLKDILAKQKLELTSSLQSQKIISQQLDSLQPLTSEERQLYESLTAQYNSLKETNESAKKYIADLEAKIKDLESSLSEQLTITEKQAKLLIDSLVGDNIQAGLIVGLVVIIAGETFLLLTHK